MSTPTQHAFEAKMRSLSATADPVPAHWWVEILYQRQRGRCRFCGEPVSLTGGPHHPAQVHQVVPAIHGGASLERNLVLACLPCIHERADRDLLDWPRVSEAKTLLRQRLAAMEVCTLMHYTRSPKGSQTEPGARRRLRHRWKHPRTTLHAFCSEDGGYFGVREAQPSPVFGFLLRQAGAAQVSPGVWRVERDDFIQVCWTLIEANAWIKRIRLDGIEEDYPPSNTWEAQWWCVVRTTQEVSKRRGRRAPRNPDKGEGKLRKALKDALMS